MFSSILTTIFIIYLYRKLNRGSVESQETHPANTLEDELDALNAQITSLERQLACKTTENLNP